MKYDFRVKPEVFKLFVDDSTDEDIIKLKEEFKDFRISYDTEVDYDNAYSLLEIMNAENDHQQILLCGIKEDDTKESLAYWLVGDGEMEDEKEDYEEALRIFEIIQNEYKID